MTTFKIVEVSQNPFDKNVPSDPKALYEWKLAKLGTMGFTASGILYPKVILLMIHFNVTNPSQLAGKTFESERNEATAALNLLLIQIAHGGRYIPPSSQTIRNRALASLASMESPDFSDVDGETVADAFSQVWNGWDANQEWFDDFSKKIELIGGVQIRKADSKEFSMCVKGPAMYLELIKDDKVQKLILGPYSTPVIFDK